jgi:hypothetical protein
MYSSQPAINTAIAFYPISLSNEGVASLLCQDKYLLSKRGIVGIGGRKGKRAAICTFEEGPFSCAQARKVEPERSISQERAFLFLLRGTEYLQRCVDA